MSLVHADLARECTRDLRRYRAQQQHHRARAPIRAKLAAMRAELSLQPLPTQGES